MTEKPYSLTIPADSRFHEVINSADIGGIKECHAQREEAPAYKGLSDVCKRSERKRIKRLSYKSANHARPSQTVPLTLSMII